jgi:ABC-type nickel/cobalt efflux system permease component RcnA
VNASAKVFAAYPDVKFVACLSQISKGEPVDMSFLDLGGVDTLCKHVPVVSADMKTLGKVVSESETSADRPTDRNTDLDAALSKASADIKIQCPVVFAFPVCFLLARSSVRISHNPNRIIAQSICYRLLDASTMRDNFPRLFLFVQPTMKHTHTHTHTHTHLLTQFAHEHTHRARTQQFGTSTP